MTTSKPSNKWTTTQDSGLEVEVTKKPDMEFQFRCNCTNRDNLACKHRLDVKVGPTPEEIFTIHCPCFCHYETIVVGKEWQPGWIINPDELVTELWNEEK